uniref:Glycoside hydrolase family 28 n=2 Tax=Verophasmatodea TaxID=213547 RepID=A0A191XT12_9NEOP|nr:glycoside hydrolase family 28 [Aretaon asperrimus]ANJ43619.1 glycoside hydrolase family 28 [Medauroidea extradentata]
MNMPTFSSFLAIFMISSLISTGMASDLRVVTEPKTPQTCTSLNATGKDDTSVIQKALDSCAKGKAVALSSGVFYAGPLTIPSGVNLLVNSGVTLKAIPDPKLYDLGKNTCGTMDGYGTGCQPFIKISDAKSSGIYGQGTIDGQGGETMTGNDMSWWRLAVVANRWGQKQNVPRMIEISNSEDITVYQVTLTNPQSYHLLSIKTNGFTVWGITVNTAFAARNADGIVADGSQNVTIAHCSVFTQSNNIIVKSREGLAKYISVFNNRLYRGQGLIIESGSVYGVSEVTYSNITLEILVYGIYIYGNTEKPALVSNITYDNICMQTVWYPVYLDTGNYQVNATGTPQFTDISFNDVQVKTPGTFYLNGYSNSHPIEITMNDVHVPKGTTWSVDDAKITGDWDEDANTKRCRYNGNY